MGDPRIVFVSREVYPFDSAGLGNYVSFTAAALAPVAEVTILTSSRYRERYEQLRGSGDPRLPADVRFEFIREPTEQDARGWYGEVHLWSARALETICRLYPDGGPDLAEFPDYLGEGCVTAQAVQTLDVRLRNTLVCVRAYTTSEMCAVLNGHLPDGRLEGLIHEVERYALRHADRFLSPGGEVLATYRAFYGEEMLAPAAAVPHTVVAGSRPKGRADDAGALRFLYVGRLERRKGVQNLIRAATSLPGSDWTLTLVGSDTSTAPLGASMREQLKLMVAGDERIRILGRVPREDLRELYADAHVCVSPSLWECWPNTVLEAFEQNRPVLATPVGGHVAMIEPQSNGWLAPGAGADDLARAMEGLLAARRSPAELIGSAAPRRAFERLADPEPVRERYLALAREGPGRGAATRTDPPPLVSVIVPYFRMERFVEETLESIAAQTYPRIETIVVNDGSLREQDAILDRVAERFEVAVVTQPNAGLGQARNLGIALAEGRYVLPLDPDDLLLPSFIERCVAVLEARPEIAYVTAWCDYIDEHGRAIAEQGYRPLGNTAGSLEAENLAGSPMVVIRRRLFDRGLRYSPDMTSYEDWLIYRELRARGDHGHVIPEALLRYRVRAGSMMRSVARPSHRRLLGELRAHAREAEVEWTSSSV